MVCDATGTIPLLRPKQHSKSRRLTAEKTKFSRHEPQGYREQDFFPEKEWYSVNQIAEYRSRAAAAESSLIDI